MKNILIKSTSILLIIIIALLINSVIFTNPIITPQTEAAGISNSDVLTGVGLAVILYLLFESIDNDNLSSEEIDNIEPERPDSYEINIDSFNVELLAKAIYAEARGEVFEGQIAVGAVIVNRMKSPNFPNTIRKVLYQPNQFKCIENGYIDQTPNQTAYRAARRAINGEDPSKGALFFFNPDKSEDPAAFDNYQITVRIGNHIFAK